MSEVTRILSAIEHGEPRAAEELLPLVYDELRRLAAQKLAAEKPGQTLQATALVHEAYLRLVGPQPAQEWDSRGHFFAAAAEAMRRILVDNARRKQRIKHGGQLRRVGEEALNFAAEEPVEDLLSIDGLLDELTAADPQAGQVVKLHFFAGLTLDDAAGVLRISSRTVYRDWAFARAWLARRIKGSEN
jgi:RNA polymerase sigma factor (TIGR02999 family)